MPEPTGAAGAAPANSEPVTRPAAPDRIRRFADRAMIVFGIVTVGLGLAYVIVDRIRHGNFNRSPLPLLIGVPALLIAAVAWGIARSRLPAVARVVLAVVIGYHASFGPALLLHLVVKGGTSNDDLIIRLYPHVVWWINSFE